MPSVNVAGACVQVMSTRSRASCARPPMTIYHTIGEVAIGTVIITGTQELERPKINQSGGHKTKFYVQQATLLLALTSEEMSSGLNINTVVVGD